MFQFAKTTQPTQLYEEAGQKPYAEILPVHTYVRYSRVDTGAYVSLDTSGLIGQPSEWVEKARLEDIHIKGLQMAQRKLAWQHLAGTDLNQLQNVIQWWKPSAIKVVATGSIDAGYLLQIAAITPPETKLIYRVLYHEGFNSDMWEHWLKQFFGDPITAADVWVDMMEDAFAPLFALAKQRWVAVETFNEQGMNVAYASFSKEVARELYNRWGLHHVAINCSVGTYNEFEKWEGVARSGLLEELIRTDGRIGVHGYASWFIRAFDGDWQYGYILNNIRPNHTPDTLWNALNEPPPLWNGQYRPSFAAFAVWNAPIHLDKWYQQLGKGNKAPAVKFHLTEFGLDNVGDPGIGKWAGGWKEWANAGAYEGYIPPGKTIPQFVAKMWDWAEKFYQNMPHVESAQTFVYDASDHDTDKWRNYRIDREIVPELKPLWEHEPVPEPTPEFCAVTPSKTFALNIRSFPDTTLGNSVVRELQVGETARVYGKFVDAENRLWYVLNEQKTEWLSSAAAIRLEGNCADLPTVSYPDTEPPADDIEALKKQVTELQAKVTTLESSDKAKQLEIDRLTGEVSTLRIWKLETENHVTQALAYLEKIVPRPTQQAT